MEKFVLVPISTWEAWEKKPQTEAQSSGKSSTEQDVKIPRNFHPAVEESDYSEEHIQNLAEHFAKKSSRAEEIFDIIIANDRVNISLRDTIIIDGSDTSVSLREFISTLTQSNHKAKQFKKIDENYTPILNVLELPKRLTTNPNAVKTNTGSWKSFAL